MNKIAIVLFFFFSLSLNAQTQDSIREDSLRLKNLESIRGLFWKDLPKPHNWTNDYEGLFTKGQEKELNDIITGFERETSAEIAIVTINTAKVADENFEALSLHIAKTWGIGKRGKDNGILIAISKGYRRMRIQNGNGIAKIMTNDETGEIIDRYFVPYFREGDYYKGTLEVLKRLIEVLKAKM